MKDTNNKKRPLISIANDFFGYLGKHLPQQCASDEFYFLPRSEAAIRHLNHLDDLTPERIQDHILYVQDLLNEISPSEPCDLEEEIDYKLLKQSMESFVREYDVAKSWRKDPTLYVKIPLFATDHVISQFGSSPGRIKADLSSILGQTTSFLRVGIKNLCSPSEISLRIAVNMTQDAINFYEHDICAFINKKMGEDRVLSSIILEALAAWKQYKKELVRLSPGKTFAIGEDALKKILGTSLSLPKSPQEILEIARYAFHKTQEKLDALAKKIDTHKPWTKIIHENLPSISSSKEFMELFQKEVQELRRFFYTRGIITFPPGEQVMVLQTPFYLQSLRATASYKAPLTGNTKVHGVFYLTPGKEDLALVSTHCPYVSAHETYPGHHILDHLRIHYSNPIRRQIESPIFYEGWACYAEQLLDEFGYIHDPRRQLIGLKRLLWRALRAELDVELQTGKITLDTAAERIEALGFSPKRARRQAQRFCLTPGYQLCYFMGMHEIIRLRKQFSPRLGPRTFHDILLGGGEIPFHLLEKRLDACTGRR